MSDNISSDYDSMFEAAGQKYGIDPLWLKAQAHYESGLDPAFKSTTSSASGLGAFVDAAAQDYGVNRDDPASSIDGLARYLKANYAKANGDPVKAVSMYKTGPNASAVDPKYVKNVTDVYHTLKQQAAAKASKKVQMADNFSLDPQDDFERMALGQAPAAPAPSIEPQDDFEKSLLAPPLPETASGSAPAPQDPFEQAAQAPVEKTQKELKADAIKAAYNEKLDNARAAMRNTGKSPTAGLPPSELGYAANLIHQIPGVSEVGSGLAATAENLLTPSKIPETYDRLEQAQQAMRQASKEQNPEATAAGEVGTGLATSAALPAAKATSILGKIAAGAFTSGAYGTAYGFGQGDASLPAEDSFYQRLNSAGKIGGASLLLGAAAPAAIEAGRGVANIFSGSSISPEVAQLAKTAADKYDIKIPGGLLSENANVNRAYSLLNRLGLTGKDDNVSNFTRAVSNTFGEDTHKLTRAAMSKASDNIGAMYDDARASTPYIDVDNNLLTRLGNAEAMAEQTLPGNDQRIQKQISNILDVASKNNGQIPVETWHSLVGSKSALTALTKSGLDPAKGPAAEIKDSLYEAFTNSAPAKQRAQLDRANKYYKNFKTVQQKGLDPVTGEFSPTALSSNVTRTAKKFGSGGLEDLQELGDIGRQFQLTPSSHTAENYLLAKGLGGGLEAGLAFHDPVLAAKLGAATVGTAMAGRGAGAALSSDWYRNVLVNGALNNKGPGLMSRLTAGSNYLPPLAYGTNQLLQRNPTPPFINQ